MIRVAATLLFALLVPAAPSSAADSYAVLAVADSPEGLDANLAELTNQLRMGLRDRAGGVLGAPEMRARLLGESGATSLAELERAYASADRAFDDAQFDAAARALRALVVDLERQPDSPEAHAQRVRVLARLAYAEKVLKNRSAMIAALEGVIALEPAYAADPIQYPPSYVKELDVVRRRLSALPKLALTVVASGGSPVEVFVDGKPAGAAPVTLQLPAGRHRVSGLSGALRIPPAEVELAREARSLELDAALAGALHVDAGPGLATAAAQRAARVAGAGAWLGATRAVAVSRAREGGGSFLVAALFEVERGAVLREGRVRVQAGSLPATSVAALTAFLLTGALSPEVMPISPKLDLSPSPALATASTIATPPRTRGWMRPAAYGSGAVALGLAAFAVVEAISARNEFRAADALPGSDGIFASASDKAAYDRHRSAGARDERAAYVGAASAALFAVGAGVLGYLSWDDRGAPVVRF